MFSAVILSFFLNLNGQLAHAESVQWGLVPYSADYQSDTFSKITARPEEVVNSETGERLYLNLYPGIKNTRRYFDGEFYPDPQNSSLMDRTKKGVPLALRYIFAIEKENQDPALTQWLKETWYAPMQPDQSEGWSGHCDTWSVWSMDPVIHQTLDQIHDGIICNGVPFTRGELKELITRLYSIGSFDYGRKQISEVLIDGARRASFYQNEGATSRSLEDANLALSKLAWLGKGGLEPHQVIAKAQQTKSQGMVIVIDRDPSHEVWNQPIHQISDQVISVRVPNVWEAISVSQLRPANDLKLVYPQMLEIERDLTQHLLDGYGVSSQRLCSLAEKLGQSDCPDLGPLVAQADFLNQLKKIAVESNVLAFKAEYSSQGPLMIQHELIFEYGIENPFASMNPDRMATNKTYYTEVRDRLADGSYGPVRSYWSPSASSLKQICEGSVSLNRVVNGLTRDVDFQKECSEMNSQEQVRWFYFTSGTPPKAFREAVPAPRFTSSQYGVMKRRAYEKLLNQMSGGCPSFDGAAQFLRDLDQGASAETLAKEFKDQRSFLDEAWLKAKMGTEAFLRLF